jgi:hypothetical protein
VLPSKMLRKMMRISNLTSIHCLVSPISNLLTKITSQKTTNLRKMPSKHLLKEMRLHHNKREVMKSKKMMMRRWSMMTKITGKRQKMRRTAKMKKRLRMTKKSKSKKKRVRLMLVKWQVSNNHQKRSKSTINPHLSNSKITQKVNKTQCLCQREGRERANSQRHLSSRSPLMKVSLTNSRSSYQSRRIRRINRWRVKMMKKREKMKKTRMRNRLRMKRMKKMRRVVSMTRIMNLGRMIILNV